MSFWGKLFGADNVVDAAIKTGDAIFYTDEEKADYKLNLLKAYEPFKLVQRYLALIVFIPYVTAWFVCFIASFWVDTSGQLALLAQSDIGTIALMIAGLYFGGGAINSFVRKGK